MTDPFEHDDAAYVLGALEPADRQVFEAHLATCAACQGRVAQARSTAVMLGPAGAAAPSVDPPSDVEPPPDTLLPGLLRRARVERRRRRVLTGGLAAVAAACLVTLTVVLWPGGDPATPRSQALSSVRDTPVTATAVLTSRTWGTEIRLHCMYTSAGVPRVSYRLVVVDTDDRPHDAGSWRLVPNGATTFTGGTAVARDRIARVQITLPDGRPVLQLRP